MKPLSGGIASTSATMLAEGAPVHVVVEPITVRLPEAVRLTGLSRSRLYELIGLGDIEIVKVGTSTLVLVSSLRSFIEARRLR